MAVRAGEESPALFLYTAGMRNPKRLILPLVLAALVTTMIVVMKSPPPEKSPSVVPPQAEEKQDPPIPGETVEESSPGQADLPARIEQTRPDYDSILDPLLAAIRSWDKTRIRAALDDLLEAITPEPVPDAENAALLYRKAFAELVPPSDDEKEARKAFFAGNPLTLEQEEHLRRYLEKNAAAIRLTGEGAQRPKCNFGVDWSTGYSTELPHIGKMIQLKSLVLLRSKLGEGEEARRSVEIAALLGDSLASEPTLLSQLVQYHSITDTHDRLQENWSPEGYGPGLADSLQTRDLGRGLQRAYLGEIYSSAMLFVSKFPGETAEGDPGIPDPATNPNWANDLDLLAGLYRDIYDLSKRPYHELKEELSGIEARLERAPEFAEMTRLLAPATAAHFQRRASAEAVTGTQRISIALANHRASRGNYPVSLAELKSIAPDLMKDPFTGQPYRYRREGNGFVLYSVGKDGLDNGGNSKEEDIIFRVGN